jgi:hypothetical protein
VGVSACATEHADGHSSVAIESTTCRPRRTTVCCDVPVDSGGGGEEGVSADPVLALKK